MHKLKSAAIFAAWFAVAILTFGPTWSGRNGAGVYTVPNSFTAGTTITASGFNTNFTDIGTELTNSVAADGQTVMTGPLKFSNGTAAAPSMTFASDTDTGFYRSTANEVSFAAGGAQVASLNSTGIDVAGTIKQNSATLVPAGAVLFYAGSSVPSGWLNGDGSSVLRATYPDLFTAIGTTYGSVDGTHFTLPDCTGRTLAGKESAGTRLTTAVGGVDGGTLGSAAGLQSRTIAQANLPNVNFTVTDPGHTHSYLTGGATGATAGGVSVQVQPAANGTTTGSNTTGISVASGGSGTALATVQPTIVLYCLIKM
jgi:microcystin-dependent protein